MVPCPEFSYVDYQAGDAPADMWVYDIFSGVQLMVVDFAIESCFRGSGKENVIGINHCEKGRYECAFDNKSYIYLGEGDIAINSQLYARKNIIYTHISRGIARLIIYISNKRFLARNFLILL